MLDIFIYVPNKTNTNKLKHDLKLVQECYSYDLISHAEIWKCLATP